MSTPCADCARSDMPLDRRVPRWAICHACSRKRHERPAACPSCGDIRVLAFQRSEETVCASCAGVPSPFACPECNSEHHPYGTLCARCTLRKRATGLLTDPRTGVVHAQLRPLLDAWELSQNPRTQIRWISQTPLSTEILKGMACGAIPISHAAFRDLPPSKTHDYLRNLLTTVGILDAWEPHTDRYTSWLTHHIIPTVPPEHASALHRFGRWHILKGMQRHARNGTLTQAAANSARIRTRVAVEFCELLTERGKDIQSATQADLEDFIASTPGYNRAKTIASFVAWLRNTRMNTSLNVGEGAWPHATVTLRTEELWANVERLLHDNQIGRPIRIIGLFTLLFAQPLNRIVAMSTQQIRITENDVSVRFAETMIEMPPIVDTLLKEHLGNRTLFFPHERDRIWLFPGSQPGRHLVTEVFRRDLNELGIKPYASRKASMFHLAATMPSPLLAGLLGITEKNAARWAELAARNWTSYIQLRSGAQREGAFTHDEYEGPPVAGG